MGIPAYGSTGTHLFGTSSSANFAVPASVAADDIIIIPIYVDGSATITALASGFAHAEGSPASLPAGGGQHSLAVVWKRATGADTGTYDFTLSTSIYRAGSAIRYTGCVTSGSPWDSPTSTATSTANDTVTPAVSITTAGADRLLIFAATNWAGGAWTPPTGFTERMDTGDQIHTEDDKGQASAGSSGSVTATCAGSDKRIAFLGALIGASAGTPVGTATETDTTFAITSQTTKSISTATETDTTFAVASLTTKTVGLATETDAAIAVTSKTTRTVGLTTETDSTFAITPAVTGVVHTATETDTAFALTTNSGTNVGTATETDTAFAIIFATAVGTAVETDQAYPVGSAAVGPGIPYTTSTYESYIT